MAALARGKRGRFISVDPNVRPTVEPDMDVWRARMAVLFPLADLVKISAEDLELLLAGHGGRGASPADLVAPGVQLVVVTDGGEAAHGWTASGLHAVGDAAAGQGHRHRRAPATPSRRRCSPGCCATPAAPKAALAGLDADGLAALLDYAARAAAITCSRRGADLPRAAELTD